MAIQQTPETVTTLDCEGTTLLYVNEAGEVAMIDLSDKFSLTYTGATHTLDFNGTLIPLNVGGMSFDSASCTLTYTDEKGTITTAEIPYATFEYDEDNCELRLTDAKGTTVVAELGAQASDVGFTNDDGVLMLTYKDAQFAVPLPNSIVQCDFDEATNTLRFTHRDGSQVSKTLACASLRRIANSDGSQTIVFDDGKSTSTSTSTFTIPAVSSFNYDRVAHTISHNGDVYQLNVGSLSVDAVACSISYRNEQGGVSVQALPRASLLVEPSADSTRLTFDDGCASTPEVVWDINKPQLTYSDTDHALGFYDGTTWISLALNSGRLLYNDDDCTLTYNASDGESQTVTFPTPIVTGQLQADGSYVFTMDTQCGPNPIQTVTIPAADAGVITSIRVEDANGQVSVVPVVDGAATIPFRDRPVVGVDDATVTVNAAGSYEVSVDVPVKSVCAIDFTGSEQPLVPDTAGKVRIPFRERPVVGIDGVEVEVNASGAWEVSHPSEPFIFGAGKSPNAVNAIEVALADGSIVTVQPNQALPPTMVGHVIVDPATNTAVYVPPAGGIPNSVGSPVSSLEVENGNLVATRQDGTVETFFVDINRQTALYNTDTSKVVRPDTPDGTVMTAETASVTIPAGRKRVRITTVTSYERVHGQDLGGYAQFRPQYSADGGATWTSMGNGAGDAVFAGGPDQGQTAVAGQDGEFGFTDFAHLDVNAAVPTTLHFRIILEQNHLVGTDGGVMPTVSFFEGSWIEFSD